VKIITFLEANNN